MAVEYNKFVKRRDSPLVGLVIEEWIDQDTHKIDRLNVFWQNGRRTVEPVSVLGEVTEYSRECGIKSIKNEKGHYKHGHERYLLTVVYGREKVYETGSRLSMEPLYKMRKFYGMSDD